MSEFVANWVGRRPAARAEDGDLRVGLGLGVALAALGLMLLPAAIGLVVLVGRLT